MARKQERKSSSWRHWLGRAKELVGEATGDRRVEAEGVAEAATGRRPDDETVERTVESTRRLHKDIPRIRRPDA